MTTQTLTPRRRAQADYLNLTLWTLQGWLTMFFIGAGYAKLTEPMANLVELMRWPVLVSENLVRGLGLAEIVLAGLMLVPLLSWRVGRPLLVTAAAGLVALETIMLVVHLIGMDVVPAVTNVLLLAITVPVLWFRARARP
tara:strand:- start:136 stop:555 length:420 start_codon:yes stop_codon:yes gene_type:complete